LVGHTKHNQNKNPKKKKNKTPPPAPDKWERVRVSNVDQWTGRD